MVVAVVVVEVADVVAGAVGGCGWAAAVAATESFLAASCEADGEVLVSSCFMSWSQTPELCRERASRAELLLRLRAWPRLQCG